MNAQDIADYIYTETTKLDAPISYGASMVMAKHILANVPSADIASNTLITTIVSRALAWAGKYPERSDGRNTFVLFAELVEGLRPVVGGSKAP